MILKIKRYFSAYNEYCEVSVEGEYINMKLIIGNRESGAGNWFLVLHLRKCLRYFKTVDREQGIGNWEKVSCSLFWYVIPFFSKVQIGNKEPVPGSFLTIIEFILVSGFAISSACKAINDTKHNLTLCVCINEYCEFNVEGAYINMKLIIGNWFLVP